MPDAFKRGEPYVAGGKAPRMGPKARSIWINEPGDTIKRCGIALKDFHKLSIHLTGSAAPFKARHAWRAKAFPCTCASRGTKRIGKVAVDERLILELLDAESRDVQDLGKNLDLTKHFLDLVTKIDSLPETNRRSFEESRSLYEAVSNGMDIDAMGKHLEGFFGPPLKPVGKSAPLTLRFNPSANYLGGIRKDQSFFVKKLKFGEFYGALWPWQTSPGVMTIHLGFCCNKMTDKDYSKLEKVVETALSEQKS